MNAVSPGCDFATAAHGETDMVRGDLYDVLSVIGSRIDMARVALEIRDDFSVTRNMRLLTAELKHGLGLLVFLEEEKARHRERQTAQESKSEQVPS